MFENYNRPPGFSPGVFVAQVFAVPFLSLIVGLLIAAPVTTFVSQLFIGEGKESLPGEIAAYGAYAAVGAALGHMGRNISSRAVVSGGRWIWVPPAGLLVLGLIDELRRSGPRAIADFFAPSLDESSGERGIVFVLLTMPAVACACYSCSMVLAHRSRRAAPPIPSPESGY